MKYPEFWINVYPDGGVGCGYLDIEAAKRLNHPGVRILHVHDGKVEWVDEPVR